MQSVLAENTQRQMKLDSERTDYERHSSEWKQSSHLHSCQVHRTRLWIDSLALHSSIQSRSLYFASSSDSVVSVTSPITSTPTDLKQKLDAIQARLDSNRNQQSDLQRHLAELNASLPKLDDEKKLAVSQRNFKLAGQKASEIKDAQEQQRQLEIELSQCVTSLEDDDRQRRELELELEISKYLQRFDALVAQHSDLVRMISYRNRVESRIRWLESKLSEIDANSPITKTLASGSFFLLLVFL